VRRTCRYALESEGSEVLEANNGVEALVALEEQSFDLVMLDVEMPEMNGYELLTQVRQSPPTRNLKVLMLSGQASPDSMAEMLSAGADDYLSKPLSMVQLLERVKAALRLKEAQDRADVLNEQLLSVNAELERNLTDKDCDLGHARNALVLALANIVGHRTTETESHLLRMRGYCRHLATEAAKLPLFAPQIDVNYIQMLESCVPLHDIGAVGLPDHILMKPGKLDPDERVLMQMHSVIGAEILQKVLKRHGPGVAFLQMAIDIARHHHERFDGKGYPDRLAGESIPLAARIVAIADVYDALRCKRSYKPALSHAAASAVMLEASAGQFDPTLLDIFHRTSEAFDRIFKELQE
jgi:response regulator RpfG family c-di-GMP phosphodiesterase